MPDQTAIPAAQQIRGLYLELFVIADPAYVFPGALSHGHTRATLIDVVDEFEEHGRPVYRHSPKTAARLAGDRPAEGLRLALVEAAIWSPPSTLKPWKLIDGRPHIATGCHFSRAVAAFPDLPDVYGNEYVRIEDYPICASDLRWEPILT